MKTTATSAIYVTDPISIHKGSAQDGDALHFEVGINSSVQNLSFEIEDISTFDLSDVVEGLNSGLTRVTASRDDGALVIETSKTGSDAKVEMLGWEIVQQDTTEPFAVGPLFRAPAYGSDG